MAGRGRTSFQKKKKEQMRLERRQQKAAEEQEARTVDKGHGRQEYRRLTSTTLPSCTMTAPTPTTGRDGYSR